jgi:hypothetical protein
LPILVTFFFFFFFKNVPFKTRQADVMPHRLSEETGRSSIRNQAKILNNITYRSFATTMSQLKISDFSGETFKVCEVLYFSMSATTKKLLSGGWIYKLRYETIPVKSAPANASFSTNS